MPTTHKDTTTIQVTINGQNHQSDVTTHRRLLDYLRDDLQLIGTKEGCGEGECGACTVLLDGEVVNSCLVLAAQVDGRDVQTVEGIAESDGRLHAVQQAFINTGAVQCGYCIPGFIVAAKELLDRRSELTREDIKVELEGNICRCTGYSKILQAVEEASEILAS